MERTPAPQADILERDAAPPADVGRHEGGTAVGESGAMLFPALALAHYRFFMLHARYGEPGGIPARYAPDGAARAPEGDPPKQPSGQARDAARRDYERALERFVASEGEIKSAYWCVVAPSGVALTEKPGSRWLGSLWRRDSCMRVHCAADWLTSAYPDLTLYLHHCDTIAMKSAEVLRGTAKQIALEWVFSEQKFLLAAAEERTKQLEKQRLVPVGNGVPDTPEAGDSSPGSTPPSRSGRRAPRPVVSPAASPSQITRHARDELLEIENYYDRAANKAARIVYFWGMVTGVMVAMALLALAALIADASFFPVDLRDPAARNFFVCFAAGALGAVVSVLMRMKQDNGFTLDYEVGRTQSFRLGSFRPFIGGVFGLVLFFAIESNLLQIAVPDQNAATGASAASFYFLALLAFAAGFSERLTYIVLGGAERSIAASLGDDDHPELPPPPTTTPAGPDHVTQLERLAALHKEGALTDDEYEASKRPNLEG